MGSGPLELFPFVVLAIKFCIFLNFVSKISPELLYLETWNFVHMTSMTSRIVGKTIRAMGPGPWELFPFVVLAIKFCIFLNFVSKISPELLYLETWNFVHMTSMTSRIVGKKIRAMGPGPLELFRFVFLAISIFLNNFYTGFQILIKFILHIHLYALHMWYENRGFRARFITVISLFYILLFWYAFILCQFCVKDISRTTLPRNLKFCTHDKYD